MADSTKNGQAKTTVHIAIPNPILKKFKRTASEMDRSLNWIVARAVSKVGGMDIRKFIEHEP